MDITVFAFTLNNRFEIEGVFDQFNFLQWERNYFIPNGVFRMEVNLNQINASTLEVGRFIAVTDDPATRVIDRLLRIEQIEFSQDETGAEGEILNIVGRDVGGVFDDRIIVPDTGKEFDEITDNAETVMKHFVRRHAGKDASRSRQISNFEIKPDKGRGDIFNFQGRFQPISEALETIAFRTGIGWEVTFDISTSTHNFDVIIGRDRTITSKNPVLLDLEFGSIRDLILLRNALETKTFAYVGGEGQGANRVIITREVDTNGGIVESDIEFPIEFPIAFEKEGFLSGFNRKEIFIDAQNLKSDQMLNLRGDAELQSLQQEDIVQAGITRNSPFVYRRDWDLGDIVTVKNDKWGLQIDLRIIKVVNVIRPGTGTIENIIGLSKPFPNLKDRIIQQFNKLSAAGRV